MAIAHLDGLDFKDGEISEESLLDLKGRMHRAEPEKPRSSVTSHLNQVGNFCLAIKEDDLVVTVTPHSLTFGRVSGQAYISHEPVFIKSAGGESYEMKHNLRRPVDWGPRLTRGAVPTALQMTLLAHQTVFNIDAYWQSIYHLLYPCFTYEGKLYLSANIRQMSDLDNFSISQLFGLLTGVEAMAREFDKSDDVWPDYPALTEAQLANLELNLTSKAEFMSPGAIWAQVALDFSGLIWATVIYTMLFGGDVKFFKADGLIDKQTRQKVWVRVLKLMETHNFKKVQAKLKVDVPRVDTTALKPKRLAKPRGATKNVAKLDPPPDDANEL